MNNTQLNNLKRGDTVHYVKHDGSYGFYRFLGYNEKKDIIKIINDEDDEENHYPFKVSKDSFLRVFRTTVKVHTTKKITHTITQVQSHLAVGDLFTTNGNFHTTVGRIYKIRLITGDRIWMNDLLWHFTTSDFKNTFTHFEVEK